MHNALKLRWWDPLQAPGQGLLHVLLDGPAVLWKELQGEVLGEQSLGAECRVIPAQKNMGGYVCSGLYCMLVNDNDNDGK